MKPLVSILIPAFNAQAWIAETLRSATSQTWPQKEIIIVDDGSSDQTITIARQFRPYGVRVVSQENQGASAARNKAFTLSQGDYIQWLDADDLLAPDKITRQMDVAQRCQSKRTLISAAWGQFMYRQQRAEFVPTALWCDLPANEWLIRKMAQNLHMQTATWLVSRELSIAAGAWDIGLTTDDDGEYFCRVLAQSDGVRFVSEAKVYYRAHGSNTLSYLSPSSPKLDSQFRSMQLHISYLRSLEDGERVRAACLSYLQTWLVYFYPVRHDLLNRMREMAMELGGQLEIPRLSWKYSWIEVIFGWKLAKRVQLVLRRIRRSLLIFWDKTLFCLETRRRGVNLTT